MKDMIDPPSSITGRPEAGPYQSAPVQPAQNPAVGGGGFDLVKFKQYLHIIIKRIWLVAICFVIALVIGVIKTSGDQSIYRSWTFLLMSRGIPLPEQMRLREAELLGDFLDTQQRIINSGTVISRARDKLNRPADEINLLLNSIAVMPISKASIIGIRVDSLDPKFSADFANAIAEAYLEFKSDERLANSQSTVVNLTQQANKIREELKKAEDQISLFKRDNSVVVVQERGNVAAKMLETLSGQTASIRMQRMILESQRPLLNNASDDLVLTALGARFSTMTSLEPQSQNRGEESGETATREVGLAPESLLDLGTVDEVDWTLLKRQKAKLDAELISARENYRDSHPMIRELTRKIRENEQAMEREVQFALRKYQSDLDALNLNAQALSRAESVWMEEALETERVFDQYNNIKRDADRLRALYEMVYSRLKEVDISQGIEPETVRQIERAVPNYSPITPRKIQSIFLSALVGIGIGLAIVFGLEFLDDSIKYPEEITKSLGLQFLGVIPAASWNPGDIRTHLLSQIDAKSGLAEAYRNVRATLLMIDQQRKIKTILVTSSVPREGKTTTSLNLAISLAQAGLRVLLVDADMRRGEIHKFFGLEGGRGLSDVLSGQTKTESVIQRTGVPNLDMIATGPFPINPAELILRNEFRSFLEYAKRSYDKVIFDGPPVMAVSEASVLSSLIDSTVMVVWAGKTSRKICQITVQNLLQRGARIDGCILNNLEFGRVGYYYYSTYYSYYNYDYRYDEKQRGT
jgi:polysaccharide biosynthesis transport protein